MKKIITILLLTLVSVKAQDEKPFSYFNLSVGIHQNKNEVVLHEFWEPQSGFNISATTPFYLGNIEAGISKLDFEGKVSVYPDFNSYFIFGGWNLDKKFFDLVYFRYGIRSGVFTMNFDDREASEYESTESELGISLMGRLEFPVYKKLTLNINSELLTIFTSQRIKLFIIGAGVSYSIDTPKWLKGFFE